MARLPRLILPGHVHHVIHRGINRQPVFLEERDYACMHQLLVEQSRAQRVAVHAWLLMDNHMHLLATPADAQGLSRLMQGIGRGYVRYFNARAGRSGTLWDGRFRSGLLEPVAHLLDAMVHLDLHPVRAGLVAAPGEYPWSSHRHYAGLANDRLVTPHALVWQLADTPFARERAYVARVEAGLSADTERALTQSALHGWPLGAAEFVEGLAHNAGRPAAPRRPGRPRRVRP